MPLNDFFTQGRLITIGYATAILILGFIAARVSRKSIARLLRGHVSPQGTLMISQAVYFVLLGLAVTLVLNQLGFKLGVLLGAAGILTVAIGFASQTSASNLISGLFVLAERPFVVGDVIVVENVTGEVLSIDLLSVKLRTFDNLFVRVPNESIIKSQITNLTHFPIRRIDLILGVAYREDLDKVRGVLFKVADTNPLCLNEPKPLFIFQKFGDSALEFQFSVWAKRENFLALRNSIYFEIKRAFDQEDIEIPFPHRTLYAGSETPPIPVRMVPPASPHKDEGPS